MFIVSRVFFLSIFVSCLFPLDPNFNLLKHTNSAQSIIIDPYIIAIMVEFESDSSPLTSGDGSFLDSIDINIIWDDSGESRCNNFIVDRPPHNSEYFSNQIKAVSNYFKFASNNNLEIESAVISNSNPENESYKLSNNMEYYALSDNRLAELFKESLELSKADIEAHLNSANIDIDQVIFTVFHAGIGQDFSFPTFDPTVYDIRSAYIEESMFSDDIDFIEINGKEIKTGILLPETQNMIFFDGIEDIFYGYDSYCDFQLGMTGTFAFLMGYALGLPPLFNTETGDPGVGHFGLMDYGSNNGRGVIPSIPTPWTRLLMDWTESINNNISNPQYFNLNDIYRFDISDNQYFLIENRSNQFDDGQTIDSIIFNYNYLCQNLTPDYYANIKTNWFDGLISANTEYNIFEFSEPDSVIINVIDYDLSLPGSGFLIWHINEPISDLNSGINNDSSNRAVHIEEADGAVDIGFESYALFATDNPTNGTKWDFWYLGNDAYRYTNGNDEVCFDSDNYEIIPEYNYQSVCEENGGIWINRVIFDKYSDPNSNLTDGSQSFFSFEILDSISDVTRVRIQYESPLTYTDIDFNYDKIIGTSPSHIYFAITDSIYSFDFDGNLIVFDSYQDNDIVLTNSDGSSLVYSISNYGYLDPYANDVFVPLDSPVWFGYFFETENFSQMELDDSNISIDDSVVIPLEYPVAESSSISIGDIDEDGLDEILYVSEDGMIVAYNGNGTLVNNFPMGNDYNGIVLIVKDLEENIALICRKNFHIEIISLNEDIISLPSINLSTDIMVINDKLTDGSRYYDYLVSNNSYWFQRYNNHSHYPLSSGLHEEIAYQVNNQKIEVFYNYPNPIHNNKTKFRFFINDLTDVQINIYNFSGYLIDNFNIESQDLTVHEYNEFEWDSSGLLPGLYFAEIISSDGQEHVIKVVIGY